MNNIYKVIWSKAKNCYVVASEIAKSHTKSASGSEKMGGYGKKALLALAAASAIFCGGLVNVGATVRVNGVTDGANEVYTTTEVNTELGKKANADSVYTKGETYTKDEVNTELGKKANADSVYTKGETYTKDEVNTELGKKANADSVYTKGETYTKDEVNTELGKKADANNVYTKTEANGTFATSGALTTAKTELEGKITTAKNELDGKITANTAKITANEKAINDLNTKAATTETTLTDLSGRMAAAESDIDGLQADMATAKSDINSLKTKDTELSGKIDAEINNRITSDTALDKKIDAEINNRITSDTALDKKIDKEIQDRKDAIGTIAENKNYIEKDKNVSDNLVKLDKQAKTNADAITETNQRTAGITRDDTKNETSIEGKVTVDTNGNIKAEGTITSNGLDARAGEIKTTGKVSAGDVSTGTLETTGNAKIGGDLTVNGKLNVDKISLKNDELKNGKKHDSATTITADEISNLAKVTEQGNTTESQFTHNEKGTFNYAKDEKSTGEWKRATSNVTADGVSNKMTDSDGNTHTYYQTAAETKEQLVNGDKSNFEKKTAEGNTISIKDKDADGNKKSLTNTQTVDGEKTSVTNKDSSSTINQGADQIRYNVTSKDENKTSSSIEVKADGITNTSKDGTITNTAKNVTNEGTESVTNTVGGNEVKVSKDGVDIKAEDGKKITESVGTASRVVENDKITDKAADSTVTTEKGKGTTFGKEGSTGTTNIYGDSIKTGKINAEDTTTDKLTAGAAAGVDGGRLTVDAKDGVKGSYKFGDYTSRSYILANTLKSGVDNDKEPIDADFVGSRTDHYMVGDKAKLDETVKDADGSNVTNKTSTGTVTTITDGATTTKTEQGTKDITNTAKDGTITNDAKDIVNNAKDTITNTAGTSITNQVKDSKVTTDANGTTFENKTAAVSDGGTTTTKINGNHINTGRVDANELGVSDKDGDNTANLTVKAGEDGGVNASASKGTTKGSLDVKADEVKTEVKDDSTGNRTNTSQTADGIKGYATDKDGNKTSTKVTATENSFQVQDKDGNIKNHQVNTKDKSENTIKNGDKTNTVTSTADGTTFNNSEAAAPVTGASGAGTAVNTTIKGNTITTGKGTMDYADVMKDLGVKGNTTLGEAGKDTTLTVNSKATFNNGLTVTNGETKLKNTTIEGTLNVFENATFQKDVTANSFSVNGKTYIDSDGLNANNQVIRNVADGSISEGSKDAVNGGQLYTVKNDLEGKVNKVGANAAAMANLHPMEFDPDSKWNIAAAIGNYGSETAAALGAFYRPNDDVMVNLSTAFGTGENMVGGGVSVRLGKGGNKLSREESNALKDQVNDLTARMDALLSVLNPNMSKDFPDVPENHWAYEAVSRLAGNDIVQGYPDGEFHGERTMTRYEMAEIIYNALSRGAEAEKELVEEFKPELQAMAASEKATAERAEG